MIADFHVPVQARGHVDSGNLLVYYEQGNPKRFVVPDVFVVKGIQPGDRRTYKIWSEGKPPDAIIEVTVTLNRLDTGQRLLSETEALQAAEQARRAEAEARRADEAWVRQRLRELA